MVSEPERFVGRPGFPGVARLPSAASTCPQSVDCSRQMGPDTIFMETVSGRWLLVIQDAKRPHMTNRLDDSAWSPNREPNPLPCISELHDNRGRGMFVVSSALQTIQRGAKETAFFPPRLY